MFLYPEHALVERILPKNKIYGHAQPSRTIRQRFVSEVEEIVWRYKLAPETIHLSASPGVEEIQVFQIALKTGELREEVLRTIDRAIPSLLFFELTFQDKVRFSAAYKRPAVSVKGEPAARHPVVDSYFESPWQLVNAPRMALPVAVDLGGLYEQMLLQHIIASPLGLCPRQGEALAATVERGNSIRRKRRECQKLEVSLRKEAQFNRRIAINAALRQSLAELAALGGSDSPAT
jgi:Domain of unknown function (DUF4391)